jgi:nucleoside-diphosphate-sugar epimerase
MVGRSLNHEWEIVEISHPLAYDLSKGYAPNKSRMLDNSNVKSILGHVDIVSVTDGVKLTADWLVSNRHLIKHK